MARGSGEETSPFISEGGEGNCPIPYIDEGEGGEGKKQARTKLLIQWHEEEKGEGKPFFLEKKRKKKEVWLPN